MMEQSRALGLHETAGQFLGCLFLAGLIALPIHAMWGPDPAGAVFLVLAWLFPAFNRHLRPGWFVLTVGFGVLLGLTLMKDPGLF